MPGSGARAGAAEMTKKNRDKRALLFDFFGTLVEYEPDRTRLGYPDTHELAVSLGFQSDHDSLLQTWDEASMALERAARLTLREFSMSDAAAAFADAADLEPAPEDVDRLGMSFVNEWARHIQPVPGASEMIRRLAATWSIAVVSNTHDVGMVPRMLGEMAIDVEVSAVVLSVQHGWMKPHQSIYRAALERAGCRADEAVFIGDSHQADCLGPTTAGMGAFLIDPGRAHSVPEEHRLSTVCDVEKILDVKIR